MNSRLRARKDSLNWLGDRCYHDFQFSLEKRGSSVGFTDELANTWVCLLSDTRSPVVLCKDSSLESSSSDFYFMLKKKN